MYSNTAKTWYSAWVAGCSSISKPHTFNTMPQPKNCPVSVIQLFFYANIQHMWGKPVNNRLYNQAYCYNGKIIYAVVETSGEPLGNLLKLPQMSYFVLNELQYTFQVPQSLFLMMGLLEKPMIALRVPAGTHGL